MTTARRRLIGCACLLLALPVAGWAPGVQRARPPERPMRTQGVPVGRPLSSGAPAPNTGVQTLARLPRAVLFPLKAPRTSIAPIAEPAVAPLASIVEPVAAPVAPTAERVAAQAAAVIGEKRTLHSVLMARAAAAKRPIGLNAPSNVQPTAMGAEAFSSSELSEPEPAAEEDKPEAAVDVTGVEPTPEPALEVELTPEPALEAEPAPERTEEAVATPHPDAGLTHGKIVFASTTAAQSLAESSNEEALARLWQHAPAPRNAPLSSVVIGAGPSGLATAIMMARRGWKNIQVFDRLEPAPEPDDESTWSDTARFYLIGLGGRGQKALKQLGAWEEVEKYCTAVVGRKDWAPDAGPEGGVERIFTDRPYLTQVLARDRLVGVLQRVARTYPEIKVKHGVEVRDVAWGEGSDGPAVLQLAELATDGNRPANAANVATGDATGKTFSVETPFLVGADGAARAVAHAMEQDSIGKLKPFVVRRYEDDNCRVYKTVPMNVGKVGWRGDINYSARTGGGRINYDALPANGAKGLYCGVLLLREDDPLAQPNVDPALLRKEMDELLPQFSALLSDEDVKAVAAKPPSRLPTFRYAGPALNRGGSTVLLGDAVHTVKPYFGLGANSALEDVIVLSKALDASDEDAVAPALAKFSAQRGPESEALVKISRELDRPGKLGFVTFILPLILDSIFNRLLPKVFAPNTIAMLQRDNMTFTQVQRRKRLDRLLQVVVLTVAAVAIGKGIETLLRVLPGSGPVKAAGGGALLALAAVKAKIGQGTPTKNVAAADVINRAPGAKTGRSVDPVELIDGTPRQATTGEVPPLASVLAVKEATAARAKLVARQNVAEDLEKAARRGAFSKLAALVAARKEAAEANPTEESSLASMAEIAAKGEAK